MTDEKPIKPVRHLLGLSGGKDSSALAIYLRDKVPEMEYFFTDTGAELPETLEFVDLLEDYLGKPIVRLNAKRTFDYYLKLHNNYLPSPRQRWCTINLKLVPFENFVGTDPAISYIAIRADEPRREGYVSTKPNIASRFPFKEDGLKKEDIMQILESSGLGVPKYYDWRSRSGCYFCFFQRKEEWLGLKEHHPDLFEKAKQFEKFDPTTGKRYTWSQNESLDELLARSEQIKGRSKQISTHKKSLMESLLDEDDDDNSCLICSL
jgi:3'-phosphoadenosine 5'-phosphosulfate sulfotransferase (PAPS reductase)/FAD synthetase